MMSFIIISNDHLIVIDGGNTCDAEYLCTYIEKLGGKVDAWFLTHPHSDHIGALRSTLERFYRRHPHRHHLRELPQPSNSIISSGDPDTKSDSVEKLYAMLYERGRSITTVHKGDTFEFGPDMKLTVLREPDLSLTENRINNASVVYRLDACPQNKGGRSEESSSATSGKKAENICSTGPRRNSSKPTTSRPPTMVSRASATRMPTTPSTPATACSGAPPTGSGTTTPGRGYEHRTVEKAIVTTRLASADLGGSAGATSRRTGTHEVPLDFDDHWIRHSKRKQFN